MDNLAGFRNECKFALLGLTNVRLDIPDMGVILADGTEVLTHFPIELDPHWRTWLGIEAEQVHGANLVFARRAATGFPPEALPISDNKSWELAKQVENLFSMLRLLGTIEYESAFLIMGFVREGQAVCQHFSKFGRYEITRGALPWMLRAEHFASAADLVSSKHSLFARFTDARRARICRGWWALTTALQQSYASDRIHGFVRALEAVIYPEIGKTEKQFVHRCALFGASSIRRDAARRALEDAYKMRCDVEHVHEWDRSLTKYSIADRENVAYWRTRQMESLACTAYARIFTDSNLQQHYCTDAALCRFWTKPEHEIRATFGVVCDITKLKLVKTYDSWGRAMFSDWPKGWDEVLKRKHTLPLGPSFRALGFGA